MAVRRRCSPQQRRSTLRPRRTIRARIPERSAPSSRRWRTIAGNGVSEAQVVAADLQVRPRRLMHPHVRVVIMTVGLFACGSGTVFAQWRDIPPKGPLTADGLPNLLASAPRLPDGKTPDLSGIWDAEKQPCDNATAALGCIDVPQGVPVGA